MATTVTKTVKSAGGDYSSLSAYEAGQQGNLVSLDEIHQAECYSFNDTTAVSFSGWTTDATRFVRVYTLAADRHAGVWNTGKYYLTNASSAGVIDCDDTIHIKLDGLQAQNTTASPTGSECGLQVIYGTSSAGWCKVTNSIFRDGRYTVRQEAGTVSHMILLINTAVYGGNTGAVVVPNAGYLYASNVTAISSSYGIRMLGGTVTAKNCYASGATGAYDGTITKTTCASSDATGDAGLQNIAYSTANFTNVTAGSEDLHIVSGSALKDVGTDLSADTYPFSDDIDGTTRSGTWDIGADEYTAAGGGFLNRNFWWENY